MSCLSCQDVEHASKKEDEKYEEEDGKKKE